MFTDKKLILFILLVLSCWGCDGQLAKRKQAQEYLQQRFTTELRQALTNFQSLQRVDTLDFNKLTPFEWDTVYVFESYTDIYHIKHDMEHEINWSRAMGNEEAVPKETNRFIFVKGDEAISYIDISRSSIGEAHFAKYYPDVPGRVTTDYADAKGHWHPYTINHFAKADARFILVCAVTIPVKSRGTFAYLPLQLLKEKRFASLGIKPTNLVDLHPVTGCGHKECLANSKKGTSSL